ncbi:MAG: multidrug efflux SMR transporter [Candidatus Limivicinus sp.]|nr:multidrug efflux SMR transporter [Clostridiales bacterium]MDY3859825.1 multidrug efflux SMR transporter [Candidatus Limivicinus sp.]
MEWVYLGIAGAMEVLWSTFMKLSDGFTKPWPTAITVAGLILSMVFLAKATKVLPMGTAYGIWTGIGALGAVIVGIVVFREPAGAARLIFALLLLAGIIGLKLTSA